MQVHWTDESDDLDAIEVLEGVSWEDYEERLARREKRLPLMFYLDGRLELMMPSALHEDVRLNLDRLIVCYAVEVGIDLGGFGSRTLKDRLKRAGAEPDAAFSIGGQEQEWPDLAIEVIVSSGGVKKLEIYRRLGVGEVWLWKRRAITIYRLRADGFHEVSRSECLPDLDLDLLCSFLEYKSPTKAMREYRAALAARTRR